jgi:YCII-related domain
MPRSRLRYTFWALSSVRDDGQAVTDGSFVATREALGGLYLIEATDPEQALAFARQCPACGVRGEDLIVRAAADAAEAVLAEPGTRPFDLTWRPMKGWLVDPDSHAEDKDLRRWVDRGLAYADSLPPK